MPQEDREKTSYGTFFFNVYMLTKKIQCEVVTVYGELLVIRKRILIWCSILRGAYVASVSLYYKYFHGSCSNELSLVIPLGQIVGVLARTMFNDDSER